MASPLEAEEASPSVAASALEEAFLPEEEAFPAPAEAVDREAADLCLKFHR